MHDRCAIQFCETRVFLYSGTGYCGGNSFYYLNWLVMKYLYKIFSLQAILMELDPAQYRFIRVAFTTIKNQLVCK